MKFDECTMQAIFNNGLENLIKGKLLESLINQKRNSDDPNYQGNQNEFTRPDDFIKIERTKDYRSQDNAINRLKFDANNDCCAKKDYDGNLETPMFNDAHKKSSYDNFRPDHF